MTFKIFKVIVIVIYELLLVIVIYELLLVIVIYELLLVIVIYCKSNLWAITDLWIGFECSETL